jgi:hypothetical protein
MAFIKRYPILISVLALCVVAFGVEAFLFVHFRGIANQAQSKLDAAQRNLQVAMGVPIAPTEQNRAAAKANLDQLQDQLHLIGKTLQSTSQAIPPAPTGDNAGTEFLADVNAYVQNDMIPLAKQKGVVLPDGEFDFGLRKYIGQVPPPPPDKISDVFKQMNILKYLLTTLMTDAKPANQNMMLVSVYREDVTAPVKPGTSRNSASDTPPDSQSETFTVSPLVSARKPGFVDTLAFQITFVGYTDSLRLLLNKIKDFELPLVVRSVEVIPATDDQIKAINDANAAAAAAAAPASTAGTAKPAPAAHAPAAKTASDPNGDPVIKNNLSQFTVIIEYIELQLPKTAEELAAEKAAADAAAAAKAAATAPAAGTASTDGTAAPAATATPATTSPVAPAGTDAAKAADTTSAPKP